MITISRRRKRAVAVLQFLFLFAGVTAAFSQAADLGYREDTVIQEPEGDEICPGAVLLQNDDGSIENGYAWRSGAVAEPDYGAWAQDYDSDFVCGLQFAFTQLGYYAGQTMDVYVWESNPDGDPAPGPDPGNVICMIPGVDPGPPALWPALSLHDVEVCCDVDGIHFVGFWPDWPGANYGWFIGADENGPAVGNPRTNLAPTSGYGTGWVHPASVVFDGCKNLAIREFSGPGGCAPTATEPMTWGRIKRLY